MSSRILIVEDDEGTRELYAYVLKGLGYRVTFAIDGAEALQIMGHQSEFDLVITDLFMPQMSGLEFLKNFRASHSSTRVIVCSGFPEGSRDWVTLYKVFAVLTKPVDIDSLLRTIKVDGSL